MKFNYLNGIDGDQSSKRLFTFILVILWVVYFIANLFWGKVLKDSLEEYHFLLIAAAFFSVLLERFTGKRTGSTETKIEIKKEETKV